MAATPERIALGIGTQGTRIGVNAAVRDAVVVQAKRAVAGAPPDPDVDKEMISAYADTEDALLPGERKVQVRTTALEEDRSSDSNTVQLHADHEITVVRSLYIEQNASDEKLYRSEEMLYGMTRLLDKELWEAAPGIGVGTILEGGGPEVTTEPERDGNIITYTVTLSTSYS